MEQRAVLPFTLQSRTYAQVEATGNGPDTRPYLLDRPVSLDGKRENFSDEGENADPPVSLEPWKREVITRGMKEGLPFRKIAKLIGMSGGSYAKFQAACKSELGIDTSNETA